MALTTGATAVYRFHKCNVVVFISENPTRGITLHQSRSLVAATQLMSAGWSTIRVSIGVSLLSSTAKKPSDFFPSSLLSFSLRYSIPTQVLAFCSQRNARSPTHSHSAFDLNLSRPTKILLVRQLCEEGPDHRRPLRSLRQCQRMLPPRAHVLDELLLSRPGWFQQNGKLYGQNGGGSCLPSAPSSRFVVSVPHLHHLQRLARHQSLTMWMI